MGTAVFKITDGTTEVNLLDRDGILIDAWRQDVLGRKGGGVWRDSPLASGRRPVLAQYDNIVDELDLKIEGSSQDNGIARSRELAQLLNTAIEYWTVDWKDTPVWIEARASCETNSRYALVYFWDIPELSNPYAQPFLQPNGEALFDDVTLVLEHKPWQDAAPGSESCLQLSGQESYFGNETAVSGSPDQSSDDVKTLTNPLSSQFIKTDIFLPLGYQNANGPTECGIRFQGMAIPQGATIISAYVRFVAYADDSTNDCNVIINGEDIDDAPTFDSKQNFVRRERTEKFVLWEEIPAITDGTTYDTPSLVPIIQEIVDRAGWANGNDIVLFFRDYGSSFNAERRFSSFDNLDDTAPILYVTYATTWTVGIDETCDDDVYVVNGASNNAITYIYNYDASGASFSANLANTNPHHILPAGIEDGDIVYFGSGTSYVNSGPFDNLIFDVSDIVYAQYSGAAEINWQYWNGAWVALNVRDNTNDGRGPFTERGVNSVHFGPPSDWTTTTVNAVTGWWVRAVATVTAPPADDIDSIKQVNRPVYTCTWARSDVDDSRLGGDIQPLLRTNVTNRSGTLPWNNDSVAELWTDRITVGARTLSRGETFNAFLNFSDVQQPDGVAVVLNAAGVAYSSFTDAPTGRALVRTTVGGSAWASIASIVINDPTYSVDYYGEYHLFFRGHQQSGSSGNVQVRVQVRNGYGVRATTRSRVFLTTNDWEALDLGRIRIPATSHIKSSETALGLELTLQMWSDTASIDVTMYDLVLIPVDEWAGDFVNSRPDSQDTHLLMPFLPADDNQRMLNVDSLEYPKWALRAIAQEYASPNEYRGSWRQIGSAPAHLERSGDQRLWFFAQRYDDVDDEWHAEPSISHSLQAWRLLRYQAMRGAS